MGNRKKDKYIDDEGRRVIGRNLRREMESALVDESDKFRALADRAKELSKSGEAPSRSTIQRICSGEVGTSIDNLFLLARAMEIPPYRLFLNDVEQTVVHDVSQLMNRVHDAPIKQKQEPRKARAEGKDTEAPATLRRSGRT